jgi:hypothetical protein
MRRLWLAGTFVSCLAAAQVTFREDTYEGARHFVVTTPAATYWYDRAGGGLSRLIDRDGHDWISFRREPWNQNPASAAAAYRGLPNFVFGGPDGGAGHPGFTQCVSVQAGNTIITESKSGDWRWVWTFAATHARVRLERAGGPYWFLYEGTPGGSYQPRNWYWGDDRGGPRTELPDHLAGSRAIANRHWAYFGSTAAPRILVLAQHEADDIPGAFSVMGNTADGLAAPDGMTVFGFGRGRDPVGLMRGAPRTWTLGFLEGRIETAEQHGGIAARLVGLMREPFREPVRKAQLGEMHYSSPIGGTTGAQGTKFSCPLMGPSGRVRWAQVGLTSGSPVVVQALRFAVQEPGQRTREIVCGDGEDADWNPPFPIPGERQLVGLSGATGWMVDNLRFHLDDGTASPLFGGPGGDTTFQVLLHRDAQGKWKGHLRGFWGTFTQAPLPRGLESVGLIFWPLE